MAERLLSECVRGYCVEVDDEQGQLVVHCYAWRNAGEVTQHLVAVD